LATQIVELHKEQQAFGFATANVQVKYVYEILEFNAIVFDPASVSRTSDLTDSF